MKQIRLSRASLLATLVTVFGACHDMDRASPLEPEMEGAFSTASSTSTTPKVAFFTGGTYGQVYTVNPDGSGMAAVPNTQGGMDPAWSPDRSKLAFTIHHGPQAGLYTINASGSRRVRLYSGSASSPSWSPDGSKIAFQAVVANKPQILVIGRTGTNLVQATAVGTNYSPSWSPDGTRLAYFGSRPEGTGIWVVAEQGGSRSLIMSCWDCKSPKWSPVAGDKRILYSMAYTYGSKKNSEIRVVNSDGSNSKLILQSSYEEGDLQPAWSPDATRIVFRSIMVNGRNNLVITRTDGSNPRTLLTGEMVGYAPAWGR